MYHTEVTSYVKNAPSEQKQIMEKIRKIIHDNVPQLTENYKWSRPVFSTTSDFAYFKSNKAYVTLGFMNYQNLEDRNNLLEGTGKDMRHIKLKNINDIDENLLIKWFKTASTSPMR